MDIQEVSSSSASTSSSCREYDVFLSFSGEDTRKNFISHLYNALTKAGFHVFKDDEELERGKYIRPELLHAIQESRYFIVVFSKKYASSTWCLDELRKIAECMNTQRQNVIPIFYDVDPSIVRKQNGGFQEAFSRHEENENKNIVQKWREALKKVADISGYDLKNYRSEAEVVEEIVNKMSTKLVKLTPIYPINLVGLEPRVEKLETLIGVGSDVRMIGICGMGGIGKTTIAKVIYELIKLNFVGSSFLEDIGESKKNDKKIISLQEKLIHDTMGRKNVNILDVGNGINEIRRLHNKKVLIVLDDVTEVKQLKFLVGEHNWFGQGSRIIITTRSKNLLCKVDQVYEAELLNDDDALELFSWNAFKECQPPKDFVELSKEVVQYSCGLPLALEVIGSSLYGITTLDVWKSAIERLSKEPKDEIINKLMVGYDGLSPSEKKIFLDIACFFKGESYTYVRDILEACGFNPIIGINTLVNKHLLNNIDFDTLRMHDLLQEMGREIVRKESSNEPGERSRLWEKEAIHHLLKENTGTKAVQGIMIDEDLNFQVGVEVFSRMINLRLLKIKNVQLPYGLKRLSNNLSLFEWHGYPLESFPSNFEFDKIVALKLHNSDIKLLWKGDKQLSKLRYISLINCRKLNELPDLSGASNLLDFVIQGCPELCKILPRLQRHKEFNPIKQLKYLEIMNCEKLIEIPDLIACFPNLWQLSIEGCPRLRSIHSPFLVHENLVFLSISDCTQLKALPSKIHMKSLCDFRISSCPKLENFPEIAGSMNDLSLLNIDGTAIKDMQFSYEFLPGLRSLSLRNNNELVSLSGLKSLEIEGCPKPENVEETLGYLSFRGCKGAPSKSYFPYSLISRKRSDAMSLKLLSDLSGVSFSLRNLDLSDHNIKEEDIPCDLFASLVSLKVLNLSSNNFVSLPTFINCLSELKRLVLEDCRRLRSLKGLPPSTFDISLKGCASLEILSGASNLLSLDDVNSINDFRVVGGNKLMFSMLNDYLKVPHTRSIFRMVMPGDKIPNWVMHQIEGCSITITRPPNLDNNKLVGVVACCVCVFHEHLVDPDKYYDGKLRLVCSMRVDGRHRLKQLIYFERNHVAKQLGLVYFDKINHDWLKFSFDWSERSEVKMCGVHPIYEQDWKDFSLPIDQSSSSSLGYLNESPGLKSLLDQRNPMVISRRLKD